MLLELKSAETSGENAPHPNETGVVTSTSGEIDVNHFMQMLAAHLKQSTL